MATANNVRRIDGEVLEFRTPKAEKGGKAKDTIQFRWDGDLYTLRKPKLAIAMQMLRLAEDEEAMSEAKRGMELVGLLGTLINYIAVEAPEKDPTGGGDDKIRGRHKLLARLNDPEDDLDILDLNEPFQELIQRMFNRPTTPRPASGTGPRRTSRGGGASSRSARAVTSGS